MVCAQASKVVHEQPLVASKQTLLRWDDARLFLAIWRAGSLKRAAKTRGVNISTASRRLDGLERALEAHLFDRTPDGTLPTAAASKLLPFAEAMEQAALGFANGLGELEEQPAGLVHLTAPPGVVDPFLASRIHRLTDRYPDVRLEVSASIDYLDLSRRQADLALRNARPAAGDLVAKRLVASDWCVVASPELAEAEAPLGKVEDHRWLTWGEGLSHLPDAAWLLERIPPERILLRCNSMPALLAAARSSLGLMLVPRPYASLERLTAVRCSRPLRRALDALPSGEMWLVGHRAHRQVPRIAAVWAWLEGCFSEASEPSRGAARA